MIRSCCLPPSSRWIGSPKCLPLRSHRAMSIGRHRGDRRPTCGRSTSCGDTSSATAARSRAGSRRSSSSPQAAGDVVAERRVDDRLDHFGRRVGLADPFQARVGAHADEHRILAAGRLGLDVLDAQDLADDLGDFHERRISSGRSLHANRGASRSTIVVADLERRGGRRRRGVAHVDHAVAFQDQEVVHQRAVGGDGLGADAGRGRLQVLGPDRPAPAAAAPARTPPCSATATSRPGPSASASAPAARSRGRSASRTGRARLTSVKRYASRPKASTAFGPHSTQPSIIRVKWTPRNGNCGSGVG